MGQKKELQGIFRSAGWLAEAKCHVCGQQIDRGEERVTVAVFDLDFESEGEVFVPLLGAMSHCCVDCMWNVEEFRIHNPWHKQRENKSQPVHLAEQASPRFEEDDLARDLAQGDTRKFDAAFPKDAESSDALARLVAGDPEKEKEISAPVADESDLRTRIGEFLHSPRSRGMRPAMREAARRYVQGANQTEIAKAMGINQATVSRVLKAVFKLMNGRK